MIPNILLLFVYYKLIDLSKFKIVKLPPDIDIEIKKY